MQSEANPPDSSDNTDFPFLRFGMIGFGSSQRRQIEDIAYALPKQTAVWRLGAFAEADAWLVCGEKTRTLPPTVSGDESLKILAGLPSERAVTLNLHLIDRPLAFSLPLHDSAMEPRLTFEVASGGSVQKVLRQFELCLRSLLSQFVLGKQLIEREKELKATTYHVLYGGKLLAVMDFISWKIGMRRDVDPQHFEAAMWEKRPTEAHAIPDHFLMTSVAQLRWVYAQHTTREVLPRRYLHKVIYLRQSPKVPVSWLTDSHLLLINELSKQHASFINLAERTGLPYDELTRGLAGLFFAASLTTTPERAAKTGASKAQQLPKQAHYKRRNPLNIFDSTLMSGDSVASDEETTVAAQLRP